MNVVVVLALAVTGGDWHAWDSQASGTVSRLVTGDFACLAYEGRSWTASAYGQYKEPDTWTKEAEFWVSFTLGNEVILDEDHFWGRKKQVIEGQDSWGDGWASGNGGFTTFDPRIVVRTTGDAEYTTSSGCWLELQGTFAGRDLVTGDVNRDGVFGSSDFVGVFQIGKYEKSEPANWFEGDWNLSGRFNSSDIIAAFREGHYERPAGATVPEPTGSLSVAAVLLLLAVGRR